jgi:hypothetical protein
LRSLPATEAWGLSKSSFVGQCRRIPVASKGRQAPPTRVGSTMTTPSPADLARRGPRAAPSPAVLEPVPEHRYHSFSRVESDGPWLDVAIDQMSMWLRAKNIDVPYVDDINASTSVEDKTRTLAFRSHELGPGRERALRFILRDPSPIGLWTVEVLAVQDPAGGGWISVETNNSEHRWVAVPSMMTGLMETLHMRDGGHDLSARPWIVGPSQVDELVAVLEDPWRRAPVFVAGTDNSLPFDSFCDRVQKWAHDVRGLSHVVVLQPAAVQVLAEKIGIGLAVAPWTLRTYQPRFSKEDSSRQHRVLSTFRLGNDRDGYLRKLVGRFSRSVIAEAQLPRELADWRRTFERLETRKLAEALTTRRSRPLGPPENPASAAPREERSTVNTPQNTVATTGTIGPEALVPRSELDSLKRIHLSELDRIMATLGIADLSESTLMAIVEDLTSPRPDEASTAEAAQQLDRQQNQIEMLEQKVSDLKGLNDDLELELVERSEWASKQERHATFWQRKVLEAGDHQTAYAIAPEDDLGDAPSTFAELFERADDMAKFGVVLSADSGHCARLDAVDRTGLASETAWNAVRALAGYLKACADGKHSGDVDSYLKQTPVGYTPFPPGKHRRGESEATMSAYGDERIFPVPTDVDPSGRATMVSHVRLSQVGMVSPRLYYMVTGDGRVVVGYIGPHLRNTMTN